MAFLPPGVSGNAGLVLNDAQAAFLAQLRAAVPPSIPLHVTSGTRSPEAQASALVTKRNLGDNLRALYRSNLDIIEALLAVPNTVAAMATVLRHYMAQDRYLSRHMRGDALDLRSYTLSPAQRAVVMQAAARLGAKTNYETKPPHIHIERIGGLASNALLAAQDGAGQLWRRKRGIAIAYSTYVMVGLLVVAALVRRKRRRGA